MKRKRIRVPSDRVAKVVEHLRVARGLWIHLSPQAVASLVDVVCGKVELADAHIGVLRLFEEAAPLPDPDDRRPTPGEIAEAEALEEWEEQHEARGKEQRP